MTDTLPSDKLIIEIFRVADLYHREAEKCYENKAYLAGCIMVGAEFEALLITFANCFHDEACASKVVPRRHGVVKPIHEWTLGELLAVAKDLDWLPSGLSLGEKWDEARAKIGDYGDIIRRNRNLVHPTRYASDFAQKRITKKYLEQSFQIFETADDYLLQKIRKSLGIKPEQEERDT